jgi:hypothetical protein
MRKEEDASTFNVKKESEDAYLVECAANLQQRQETLKWYRKYIARINMQLVPLGMVMRGPGHQYNPKDDTAKSLSYGGYEHLGIVLSLALPNGEEPAEWLIDIMKRIESFALSELDKVPCQAEEGTPK